MARARSEHVDAVIVGSGFGGAVSAFRLAEAGLRVVVLERGKAYPPGSFPRSPADFSRAFWDPSEGLQGLFDVWTFRGIEAVVSAGLGGGSLIYANVLLRKDERWFVHESPIPGGGYESWPVTRAELDPHYDSVERMLQPQRFPLDTRGYDGTGKTLAMRSAARRLDLDWQLPPLAVSFAPVPGQAPVVGAPIPTPEYGNLHGLPRRTCRLCGECDIGCNDGAKNTLDHTFLSAAQHHGADLRTRCEVRGLSPRAEGGYELRYVVHEPDREGRRTRTSRLPLHTITCDKLVLAAGTFGTTYLLLRNRAAFPELSGALGTRFSGNGDLLTFVKHAREGGRPERLEGSRGPVITSAIRVPDAVDGGRDGGVRGYYVEDAGYPGFADWLVETTRADRSLGRTIRFGLQRLRARLGHSPKTGISAEVAALLGAGDTSAATLPLIGMGRDVPDGKLFLDRGYLESTWTLATSEEYFTRMRDTMRAIADAAGGGFADNPLWWGKRVITVHPVGGAPMADHPGVGVCDAAGQVFGYPGMAVADGSLMPGPVGPNPSFTIAALADRACDRLLSGRVSPGVSAPGPAPRVPAQRRTTADVTSLSFTEEMKGFAALGVTDPEQGARLGRARGDRLAFRLTITADDVQRFVTDAAHEGRAEGWIECDLLGGRRPVSRGVFNLFTTDGDPARRAMRYRLWFTDGGGNPMTLVGRKDVHDDAGADLWPDTTTLYVRLLSGDVDVAEEDWTDGRTDVLGAAVITIAPLDFLHQLTTFSTRGPDGPKALAAFGRLFLGELWSVYGSRTQAAEQEDAVHEGVLPENAVREGSEERR